MGIYIILMIFCILYGLFSRKDKKNTDIFFCIVLFVALSCIAGLRSVNIGIDTYQFCYNYTIISTAKSLTKALSLTRFESGFVTMCYFLSKISKDYQLLLMFTSVIIFGGVSFFIKKNSKDIPLSIYLFITLNYFGMYMNVMRQALAISIILIAYETFLKQKKTLQFLLLVILSSFFHRSALIALFIPLILKLNFKPKWMFLSFVFGTSFFLVGPKIISYISTLVGYEGYITKSDYFSSNYYGALLLFAMNLLFFLFCFFKRKKFDENEMNLLKISYISLIISLCTMKISIIGRISEYFSIFNIILVSNAMTYIRIAKNRLVTKTIIIVLLFLQWFCIAIYRPEWHGVVPYEINNEVLK